MTKDNPSLLPFAFLSLGGCKQHGDGLSAIVEDFLQSSADEYPVNDAAKRAERDSVINVVSHEGAIVINLFKGVRVLPI